MDIYGKADDETCDHLRKRAECCIFKVLTPLAKLFTEPATPLENPLGYVLGRFDTFERKQFPLQICLVKGRQKSIRA